MATNCPNCGTVLPANLMNGHAVFPCSACRTPITPLNFGKHPIDCPCEDCERQRDEEDLNLALRALREMKSIQRENLQETLRIVGQEPLPTPPPAPRQPTIIQNPSSTDKPTVIQLNCAHCGRIHDRHAKFCPNTGKPLGNRFCVHCGQRVALDAKFCATCGSKLD